MAIGLYCASEKGITEKVLALYYATKGKIYLQLAPALWEESI